MIYSAYSLPHTFSYLPFILINLLLTQSLKFHDLILICDLFSLNQSHLCGPWTSTTYCFVELQVGPEIRSMTLLPHEPISNKYFYSEW